MSADSTLPIQIARQIDRLCLQFEQAWQSERRPLLEQHLEQWDGPSEYRPYYFEELLRVELEALKRENILPGLHQYVVRFPDDADVIHRVFSERTGDSTDRDLTATFVPEAATSDDELPTQIGRYLIQEELGRGAFGIVYLAEDPKLECRVAIKRLNRERVRRALGSDRVDFSQVIENLMREARLAARLRQYQGIVAVLDVLTTSADDSPADIYFVQEFIDGGPLKELIKQGPVSPTETARILQLVARAMDHVHQHGIYHRDLKPGNIILDSRGNPCVVDFGLAIDAELQKDLEGQVSGTLPYMAPEQMRGEAHLLDGRADIWAVGVILYEMLTGRRPFQGKSRFELSEEICRREPVPPRTINPQLPAELERICLKCLSKRMADRYATAGALSEDLRQWRVEYETGRAPVAPEAQQPARIVPRGLRSFGEDDAEFFPQLLPGPRDRHGLPESIRFWKERIEEKDADETFRVGLLYGPSGCGKSSLVRAGLLPRLNQVVPVYVESTADDTEARLLGRLRTAAPQLSRDLSLPEAMMALREHPALSGFKKVLLVFDQFEQWLQSRSNFGREQLIEALRQCDGARVQALLLVRDDFWMAVTRFLHELEVDLIPGENVAAVDLFPPEHARDVLTGLGRAYGRLDENGQPTPEQEEFIRKAVAGLSRDGKVICVRLAVFAEMVKDKEWVPRTMDQVGGTEGVGEQFLDEAFSSPAANPKHRLHEQAARQVLQALLPGAGTNIRGHMRSRAELLDASGYRERPADFEELLRILDGELRLITPTDPGGLDREPEGEADSAFYQLTHDYLVPSLRNWLTRKQRATRKGRAELLLSELAESWRLKPEARRLPSPLEWMSIVWWTRRSERTETQQEMVRATTRRLARGAGVCALGLLLLVCLFGLFRANHIVETFASAEPRELPSLTGDLTGYRVATKPLVQRGLDQARKEGDPRREQRLQLALAVLDPSRASAVFDSLDTVPVEELDVHVDLLKPHSVLLQEGLWQRYDDARDREAPSALKLAAFLATLAPHDPRWNVEARFIADQLIRVPRTDAAEWQGLLEPVLANLAPKLVHTYTTDRSSLSRTEQTTLLDLIMDYASESPELLAETVEYAAPDELPNLLTLLENDSDAWPCVQNRLGALQPSRPTSEPASLSAELKVAIEAAGGLVSTAGAFVQTLPHNAFDGLDTALRTAGYAPTSVRPYRNGDELLVAAVWEADSAPGEIRWGLRLDELELTDAEMRQKRMLPVDFARYRNSGDPDETQWVVVWATQEADEPLPETKFIPAATLPEYREHQRDLLPDAFSVRRFDIWMASDGRPRCTMIWTQNEEYDHDARTDWRYARAFGDLSPGQLQTDIRFEWIAPESRDRLVVFRHFDDVREMTKTGSSRAAREASRRELFRYEMWIGDFDEAEDILDDPDLWESDLERLHRYRALLSVRCEDVEQLLEDIDAYSELESARPDVIAYLKIRAAVLARDSDGYADHLETLLEFAERNIRYSAELLSRADAVLASREEDPDAREAHVRRSITILSNLVQRGEAGEPEVLLFDVDFDPVRDTAQLRALLQDLGFRQRFATSYALSLDRESRQLNRLSPTEHLRQARLLRGQGFQPHVVTVQADESDGGLHCASVWHRRVLNVDERIEQAHRKANLLLAAARFGDPSGLQAALSTQEEPDIRSYVILHAPDLLPLRSIQSMLKDAIERLGIAYEVASLSALQTDSINVTEEAEVQALLLILGGIPARRIAPVDLDLLMDQFRNLLDHRQTGVRSAARWCLRQWKAPESAPSPPRDARDIEFQNPAGQRMLVVTPPNPVLMGSPRWEPGHQRQETRNWIEIPRTYALAETETTKAALLLFLQDPDVRDRYDVPLSRFGLSSASEEDDHPVVGVPWRVAAMFCQWLSERDPNIDEDDYCYPDIWTVEGDEEVPLPDDYLQLTGYRLPTEAEWEWAARGGVQTASRFCGDDPQVLEGYAWSLDNSPGGMQPVATRRPNPFGFYDMLGNAIEWCDDVYDGYRAPRIGYVRSDADGNENYPLDTQYCVQRGGTINLHRAEELRSANRFSEFSSRRTVSMGFRVARTMPER